MPRPRSRVPKPEGGHPRRTPRQTRRPSRQPAGHRRESLRLRSGVRVTLRPVVVEDLEQAHSAFAGLSEQTRYFRYQRAVPKLTAELIVESITPRTKPSVILVATVREGNLDRLVGGGRIEAADQADEVRGPKRRVAEFAVTVVDAWQSKGIGAALLRSLCRRAREMGYRELVGDVLAVNTPMLALTARLGFTNQERLDPGEVVRVRRAL